MAEGGPSDSDNIGIARVIDDVRQSFLDSGMDLETLAKLEKLWISKLSSMDEQVVAEQVDAKKEQDGSTGIREIMVTRKM